MSSSDMNDKPWLIQQLESQVDTLINLERKTSRIKNKLGYVVNSRGVLVGLSLYGLSLDAVPNALSACTNLEFLNIAYNKIKTLEFTLPLSLTYLDISHNQFEQISFLKGQSSLEILDASHNQITQIDSIQSSVQVQDLDLSNNKYLSDIAVIASFKKLLSLKIDKTNVRDLSPISHLTNLKSLHLNQNDLTDTSALSNLKQLRELKLSSNKLEKVGCLENMKFLEVLDLSFNRLESLGEFSGWIKVKTGNYIKSMNLAGNQIKNISILSPLLDNRKITLGFGHNFIINVEYNPISIPPIEFIKQDHEALRALMKDVYNNITTDNNTLSSLNEINLLLIGQSEKSKSKVKDAIKDESESSNNNNNSAYTVLRCLNYYKSDINIKLWDFDNEGINRHIYQFFFPKYTFCLITVNNDQLPLIPYWLKEVESISTEIKSLLIIDQTADSSNTHIDESNLSARFPSLIGIHKLNSENSQSVKEFGNNLLSHFKRFRSVEMLLPKNWICFKGQLLTVLEKTSALINAEEIEQCKTVCSVDSASEKLILNHFQDTGLVVPYYSSINSADCLSTYPKFIDVALVIIDAAYKGKGNLEIGLTDESGLTKTDHLTDILNDYNINHETLDLFLNKMNEMGACFSMNDNEYCFPYLLSESQPTELPEHPIRVRYQFKNLPTSILYAVYCEVVKALMQHGKDENLDFGAQGNQSIDRYEFDQDSTDFINWWRLGFYAEKKYSGDDLLFVIQPDQQSFELRSDNTEEKSLFIHARNTINRFLTELRGSLRYDDSAGFSIENDADGTTLWHFEPIRALQGLCKMGENLVLGKYKVSLDPDEKLAELGYTFEEDSPEDVGMAKDRHRSKRKKVFISYSRKDIYWCDLVKKKLQPIKNAGLLEEIYLDRDSKAGQNWKKDLDKAVKEAKVAIILVSDYFLSSEFIEEYELKPFIEAYNAKKITVLPVILERVYLSSQYPSHLAIKSITSLNPPDKPFSQISDQEIEDYLVDLAKEVDELLSTK